jgi:hypothetical protein
MRAALKTTNSSSRRFCANIPLSLITVPGLCPQFTLSITVRPLVLSV